MSNSIRRFPPILITHWPYIALLSCATLLAQSVPTTAPPMVHVSGSVTHCGKAPLEWWHVLVRFKSESSEVAAVVRQGQYEADLPLGVWTLTTPDAEETPESHFHLSRPRHFVLTHPGTLVLNIYLQPQFFCNVGLQPEDEPRRDEFCYGEASFQALSAEGVPFEVDLFGLHDVCSIFNAQKRYRESATYNLLTVEADKIIYNAPEAVLEASGHVVIYDESGKHRKSSAKFQISEGRASALPSPKVR